jgi:hypothetical protein
MKVTNKLLPWAQDRPRLTKWLKVSIVMAVALALYVYSAESSLIWHIQLVMFNALVYKTLENVSTPILVGMQIGYSLVLVFLYFFAICLILFNLPGDLKVPQCMPWPQPPLRSFDIYPHLACCLAVKLGLK